ncbi:Retrovirus-related Pol polyprotein from transposon 297 [Vitis vinifera]|uniref:Retrovirus-related Pol polyprotein from transposon 297 n=1 Tax=Vitis vinifera TaxID=29760 RepID=A0A438DHS1_VITVI|nr:Retrovirus-related Pol polyprotein from transposon 297 [Vitis vinifera]
MPYSTFDLFSVSMLEMDGDDSITNVATLSFIFVEGASDPVDPSLSFDFISEFVTYYDVMFDENNNDMSLFEYLRMSQHFPLIAPQAPTTPIHDIDDVRYPDDPLSGQLDCDSNSEERKVTPVSDSAESMDFGTSDQPKELKIGSSLSLDKRSRLIELLRSYMDVFAWSNEDMPSLDPSIAKEEIMKQLNVGFLSVVKYPEWLANVIPVPKKDNKVRVCVDYMHLNKASPKDDFPLPHIDMLVDSTAGHSMLSFMDGFCRVMPFGLKNTGATYQRAATTLFHDMMHKDVEVYIDDTIVKSQDRADHLATLQRFFEKIRQFRLRLNPKKCTFGVISGKLLGHIVNECGVEVDPEKIRPILDMLALRTERERDKRISRQVTVHQSFHC